MYGTDANVQSFAHRVTSGNGYRLPRHARPEEARRRRVLCGQCDATSPRTRTERFSTTGMSSEFARRITLTYGQGYEIHTSGSCELTMRKYMTFLRRCARFRPFIRGVALG